MKETPLRVGYIRIHFNNGTYKDFRKDDENLGIITPEQRKARGYYLGSKRMKEFLEKQKTFSKNKD